jgi:hypothetical protein
MSNSIIGDVVEAAVKTVVDPNPVNVLQDVQLGVNVINKLKEDLKDAHPSIWDILKSLL